MAPLICPKCGGTMSEIDHGGTPCEKCTACGGMWFDYFALVSWFEKHMSTRDTGIAEDFMSRALSEPTELSCPRCDASLLACKKDEVTVEWCASCRGIYLDEDEPDRIVAWRRGLQKEVRKDTAKAATAVAAGFALSEALDSILGGLFRRD